MAQWCRQRVADRTAALGDAAREVLGDVELARLTGLMNGTIEPIDEREYAIAQQLRSFGDYLGRVA